MIKFNRINTKRMTSLLLSGLILMSISGCSNKKNNDIAKYNTNEYSYQSKNLEQSTQNKNNKQIINSENIEESNDLEQSTQNSKQTSTKEQSNNIINYLENIDNKITNKLYKTKDELIKDYGIIHDFIFDNGTIKGYTFNELKENIKEKIINLYLIIDEKIDTNYPNYKETIKEKYSNIKDKVKDKLNTIKNNLKDKIGEDKYNSIIDKKDTLVSEFKEQTRKDLIEIKELGKKAKDKLKTIIKK